VKYTVSATLIFVSLRKPTDQTTRFIIIMLDGFNVTVWCQEASFGCFDEIWFPAGKSTQNENINNLSSVRDKQKFSTADVNKLGVRE
jgi:hypothetical protein